MKRIIFKSNRSIRQNLRLIPCILERLRGSVLDSFCFCLIASEYDEHAQFRRIHTMFPSPCARLWSLVWKSHNYRLLTFPECYKTPSYFFGTCCEDLLLLFLGLGSCFKSAFHFILSFISAASSLSAFEPFSSSVTLLFILVISCLIVDNWLLILSSISSFSSFFWYLSKWRRQWARGLRFLPRNLTHAFVFRSVLVALLFKKDTCLDERLSTHLFGRNLS